MERFIKETITVIENVSALYMKWHQVDKSLLEVASIFSGLCHAAGLQACYPPQTDPSTLVALLAPRSATVDGARRAIWKIAASGDRGRTRVIVESLTVPVRFDTVSEEKRDETKPTRPLTAFESDSWSKRRATGTHLVAFRFR